MNANSLNYNDEAAKSGTITGKITDAETNEKLPYVNIVIKNDKSEILTGGITDDQGLFEIKKIPLGNNIVEIQFIGYKTESRTINFTKDDAVHTVGTIALTVDAAQLDEVEVIAEVSTVVQKIDRKVINVGKDLTAAGTTASELLNNVQSVSVDSQTGQISLRGNENVRILVDGKPTNISAAQLLQQIPSTSIKQVELITNPSAKYNPEGMSGIINIVLHKSANQGFNGTINTGVTQGENTRFNGSLDMNYKTGVVNFFANYGHNNGNRENYGYVNRVDNNSLQEFEFDQDNTSNVLKIGADVYLNEKNTFSFYTTQNQFDNELNGTTKITDDGNLVIDGFNNSISDTKNASYNFNYKLDFEKEDHSIEFDAALANYDGPESTDNGDYLDPTDPAYNYIAEIANKRNSHLYNLDYTNPLSETSKLELGLEVRGSHSENEQYSTQVTPTTSTFDYKRNIYSGYVNYMQQWEKLTMQIGARLEQYDIHGTFTEEAQIETVTDEIFSIYPSAFFTYNPSDKNQFQVSYSRRVDRPSLQQINPIRDWSSPRITSAGNPELTQQFTNSYEINFTRQLEKGSFSFGTFYRQVNDNITRIINEDPLDPDKLLLTFDNTDSSHRYGFEASFNYAFFKWWRANASADLYVQEEFGIANEEQIEVTNNAFNARISNNFTVTKKLRLQLFAMYRGGAQSIQFKTDPMWMLNTGASYNVFKEKGTITFRVNDIFQGMKSAFESTNPYPQNGQFNWESRTAYLGFNYRFGGGKNKERSRKNRDNNESQGSGGFM